MDQCPDIIHGQIETRGINAENSVLSVVPHEPAIDWVPFPGSHLAGGQCQAASLLTLQQPHGRGLKFRGSLGDATLELLIELLELSRLAIELGENLDLGAQNLGNDWHRHVIDGPHLIGAQAIDVRQMDGRDEDDRGALEPRMLADHRRQLEAVELRHAHVDEDDRNLLLEQVFQRFLGRSGFDQPLVQPGEDGLIAQELGRLVVDQQDIDLVVRGHRASPLLAMQPHAQRR